MEKRESENDLSAIQFDRERLEAENKELKAAIEKLLSKSESVAEHKAVIEELIPIAEDRLFAVPVKSLEGVQEVIERAKKLIKL